ncbi:hypothetical protein UFOVP245_113 [uncultured Caudovirales phage]|uniref:Uncharacterized protein n=1 Tax=uncultured Caudovirales phage TaxID=2100421 RepID=A0A6J7WTG0_9CAUD|nr:hypothetical protein UFOVP245_113 [uncultured Caudovirales phage]
MRDKRITVANFENVILTLPRASQETLSMTIIVKQINNTIEPISILKQKASSLTGTTPTVPRTSPTVAIY